MFSVFVLVFGCLLQRKLVTTEGHRGTNRHVFYTVQMDGGTRAARSLAEQHGLEFIQRVGSLERIYTLRDSRGRPDRATFEDRLATAAGFAQGAYNSSALDLNVMPVWRNNITGDGVVVSIIDDGVDYTNKDLKKTFHGTHCAGEVAMEANNSYCGVGIAFNARIGGIRLLDGPVTDAMEATALTFNTHFIDIYVCSWGPRDDGAEMDGPHSLTERALQLGTRKGRGGKGSIFVWAAGNGGMQHDHCGADGYVNSIYNIAIGAVSHTGKPAFFGEPCPGVMAVTLTGASVGAALPLVTLTSVGDGCVTHFPGTSSTALIAAGILALALEVNPELTWRDVQHLIARTAKIPDPAEPGWSINTAGYHVHHRYGFGLLDAGLMVQQAAHLRTAAPQRKCTQKVTLHPNRVFSSGGGVRMNIQSEACRGRANAISALEHVQVIDHKGTVSSCSRPSEEEAAGALLSVTLILYGTYHLHRTTHEGPLRSIVSMGSHHPVPHREVYQRDCCPPLDLLQWVYQMERDRKVRPANITVPARPKMLETPGERMVKSRLNKSEAQSIAFKLHQTDVVQRSSMRSRPGAVKELPDTRSQRSDVHVESRSLPSQTVQDVSVDQVQQSDSPGPVDGGTVSREGTGQRLGS